MYGTLNVPLAGAALVMAGATPATATTAFELLLFPPPLWATIVQLYDVPFVSPLTTIGEEFPCAWIEPGLQVAVKRVAGTSSVETGVNARLRLPEAGVAELSVGADGAGGTIFRILWPPESET